MKYALVDGQRQEAKKDLKGTCPACGASMIARCGEERVHHWAHKGRRQCDPWWENETEWHREWKNQFPEHWQEVRQQDETGEWHIADVKTDEDWVIEFQYSRIEPEERRSRDVFYPKLVWVINGTRLKNDGKQFFIELLKGIRIGDTPLLHIHRPDKCRLLREWSDSNKHLFLDFGLDEVFWLFGKMPDKTVLIATYKRTAFIESHRDGGFEELVKSLGRIREAYIGTKTKKQVPPQPPQKPAVKFRPRGRRHKRL